MYLKATVLVGLVWELSLTVCIGEMKVKRGRGGNGG